MRELIRVEARPVGVTARFRYDRLKDGHFLVEFYRLGGVMALDQVFRVFYQFKVDRGQNKAGVWRTMEHRMRQRWLYGLLNRFERPKIYFLARDGAIRVAESLGQPLSGANRLYWQEKPNTLFLTHDLENLDFFLDLKASVAPMIDTEVLRLLPSQAFRGKTEKVVMWRAGKEFRKGYEPDGLLEVKRDNKTFLFFGEYDRDTMDCKRFVTEKAIPLVIWMKSKRFRERFGSPMARMLTVTTSAQHLLNLKKTTETYLGDKARWFLFATRDQVTADTGLSAPIWLQGRRPDTQPIDPFSA